MEERERRVGELLEAYGLLVAAAELGAQRARKASDPILRARWLAIPRARAEQRDRLLARPSALGIARPGVPAPPPDAQRDIARRQPALLASPPAIAARGP